MRASLSRSRYLVASIARYSPTLRPSLLSSTLNARTSTFAPSTIKHKPFAPIARFNSSLTVPTSDASDEAPKPSQPSYQLTFTCKPCSHRSTHQVTKQGYHHGTVLITCPSCKNRHVISDHLKIFMDQKSTLEDILREKAGPGGDLSRFLKKGKLGIRQDAMVGNEGEEDVEFWEDGTESLHTPPKE